MKLKDNHNKIINRRFFLISSLKIAIFSSLTWRLFELQLIENKKYNKLSEKNQFNYTLVLPERGQILDRGSRVLAGNMDSFNLILNWSKKIDIKKFLSKLNKVILLNQKDINDLLNKIIELKEKKIKSRNLLLVKNLSQKEVSKLAVRLYEFPELKFIMSKKRIYPQGGITAHITGYTGTISSTEIHSLKLPQIPGLDVGKSGLEKYFDYHLRGNFGRKRDEVTARGLVIDSNLYENPISGKNLRTSIDLNIQSFSLDRLEKGNSKIISLKTKKFKSKKLKNKSLFDKFVYVNKKNEIVPPETGSVVIMNINNGEILSTISSPHFNPNIFSRGLNKDEWMIIKNNKKSPLLNRSVAGLYPPGSTIKMAVALAALENDIISINTRFNCSGFKEYGNMKFHCWAKHGHGNINLIEAIERSCDVYFYELGLKVGIDKISKMLKKLGLGSKSDIELNEIRNGLIPSKHWKLKQKGQPWTPGETINASIGQGYMLVTPLQLVTMTARIANGKYAVEPTLLIGENKKFNSLNINSKHLTIIKNAMNKVVNSKFGTAYNSKILSSRYKMAGKTGTVQVVRISESEREKGIIKNEDRIWKKRDHALFVGYAPLIKPKYAISVVVEHGGSGSTIAAPIARDIFSKILNI